MWTFPVLLDSRPGFLSASGPGSLLLTPLGRGTVLGHMRERIRGITAAPPVIVTSFELDAQYEEAIRRVWADVEAVETESAFAERCRSYDPSDRLLLADPSCFPLDPRDPAFASLRDDAASKWVTHLVAFERHTDGTLEYVDSDSSGRVRGIQRYYDSVTSPFAFGVACSLVPVACLRVVPDPPMSSLPQLRRLLAYEGAPSSDVPLKRGALNLATPAGVLAANERVVLELTRTTPALNRHRSWVHAGKGVLIHPSVTVVGPVVLQDGTEVQEGATLIGPSVIGPGGRIGARATVAQSVVGTGLAVPSGMSMRHQVLLGDGRGVSAAVTPTPEVPGPSCEPPAPGSPAGPRRRSAYLIGKRLLDVVVAAAGLLLFAPLGVIIAALIKLESRGPIHFGHPREGMGGRPFRCWKFRTMIPDADVQQRTLAQNNQLDGPQFKIGDDPRRTRVGRFLTASNLDELPQLWNVLVGHMSLVGPRPSPFRENQICVPWREGRLSVRPGITGLWQVCRHDRDQGDFHQWVYYDLLYVQNASAWLDIKIVLATFASLARGGHVPLSWLLPPEKYGERRAAGRGSETIPGPQPERRGRARYRRPAQAPQNEDSRLVPGESDVIGG
jgi:lipopolysaccharide/colanic/teichoic acid biosynthesis glycosyltransferase